MIVYTCPVCNEQFMDELDMHQHFRNKRKNKEHSFYINDWVRKSFYVDDPHSFLHQKYLSFSKQSLNEKWKRWYSPEERSIHGKNTQSKKMSGRTITKEHKDKVSKGLKKAYAEGRKLPPMKGKTAHNKGKPCSKDQRRAISLTLRRKYASGEIKLKNNGNNFHYGFRDDIDHFCRSSWEANIARMLKQNKVEYEYEKHRFVLHSSVGPLVYVPDFFLIAQNMFLEVKGRYEDITKLKHKLFVEQYPQYKWSLLHRKKYFKIERKLCRIIVNWELSRKNIDLEKYLIKS